LYCHQQEHSNEEDLESYLTDIRYLYDGDENYVDPNDMFADFQAIRTANAEKDNILPQEDKNCMLSVQTHESQT